MRESKTGEEGKRKRNDRRKPEKKALQDKRRRHDKTRQEMARQDRRRQDENKTRQQTASQPQADHKTRQPRDKTPTRQDNLDRRTTDNTKTTCLPVFYLEHHVVGMCWMFYTFVSTRLQTKHVYKRVLACLRTANHMTELLVDLK